MSNQVEFVMKIQFVPISKCKAFGNRSSKCGQAETTKTQDCNVVFSDHKTKATLEMVNGDSKEKKKLQRMHSNRNVNGTNKYASMTTDETGMELTGCRTITSASWGRPRMVRARTRPVLIYNSIKAEDVLFLKRSMRFILNCKNIKFSFDDPVDEWYS
ncbi:uncharacterized protein Bfra_000284 [Botrytis fragariae]|uniref:Uncharacterized protein n=1 Tax=Botrytis fragariae TaxID=1964551 RepID=A0A8H6EMU0_9HELO|nr:uncharacterized protein Bfra_000284 [Botrytis fragariae]KAF5878116.1 hypothetical protein Bfra_000284 [Botrytis fragariae]